MGVNITTIDYLRIKKSSKLGKNHYFNGGFLAQGLYKNSSNSMDLFSIHSLNLRVVYIQTSETPGRAKRASSNVAKRMPGVEHIAGGTEFGEDTVHGRNPVNSPVDICSLSHYFKGFNTSQVVAWDFFHQQ